MVILDFSNLVVRIKFFEQNINNNFVLHCMVIPQIKNFLQISNLQMVIC